MSQFPKGLPKGLRDLFSAMERGELDGGSVEEITGEGGPEGISEVVRLLAEISAKLDQLPADIWDEVEGR